MMDNQEREVTLVTTLKMVPQERLDPPELWDPLVPLGLRETAERLVPREELDLMDV